MCLSLPDGFPAQASPHLLAKMKLIFIPLGINRPFDRFSREGKGLKGKLMLARLQEKEGPARKNRPSPSAD